MYVQNVRRVPYDTTITFFSSGWNHPVEERDTVYAASDEDAKLRARDLFAEKHPGKGAEIVAVVVRKKEVPYAQ